MSEIPSPAGDPISQAAAAHNASSRPAQNRSQRRREKKQNRGQQNRGQQQGRTPFYIKKVDVARLQTETSDRLDDLKAELGRLSAAPPEDAEALMEELRAMKRSLNGSTGQMGLQRKAIIENRETAAAASTALAAGLEDTTEKVVLLRQEMDKEVDLLREGTIALRDLLQNEASTSRSLLKAAIATARTEAAGETAALLDQLGESDEAVVALREELQAVHAGMEDLRVELENLRAEMSVKPAETVAVTPQQKAAWDFGVLLGSLVAGASAGAVQEAMKEARERAS